MGELWTHQMEREPQCWQASRDALGRVDFLITEPGFRDVLRGLADYIIAALRYRALGGYEYPWTFRNHIDWFNNRRLLEPIGDIPPAEFEQMYYERQERPVRQVGLN